MADFTDPTVVGEHRAHTEARRLFVKHVIAGLHAGLTHEAAELAAHSTYPGQRQLSDEVRAAALTFATKTRPFR